MSTEKLNIEHVMTEYKTFQEQNQSFGELIILSPNGNLEYTHPSEFCSDSEAQSLFEAWKNHGSAAVIGEDRYPIISWEELQFAARNVKGKGALVGCKTKTNRYIVVHLLPGAKDGPTTAAIKLNRWSWSII